MLALSHFVKNQITYVIILILMSVRVMSECFYCKYCFRDDNYGVCCQNKYCPYYCRDWSLDWENIKDCEYFEDMRADMTNNPKGCINCKNVLPEPTILETKKGRSMAFSCRLRNSPKRGMFPTWEEACEYWEGKI